MMSLIFKLVMKRKRNAIIEAKINKPISTKIKKKELKNLTHNEKS